MAAAPLSPSHAARHRQRRGGRLTRFVRRVGSMRVAASLDDNALDAHAGFACRLADAAAKVTTASFRSEAFQRGGDGVERKADASPVTFVDRGAELAMRELIEAEYNGTHGIVGEEYGSVEGDKDMALTWVLDPIDGTKSFITGKPLYTTLVALTHAGEPIVGVIDQPVLGERWVGVRGRTTTFNGRELRAATKQRRAKDNDDAGTSEGDNVLAGTYLYATSPQMFSEEDGSAAAFERLRHACGLALYGCDAYAYGLLASGFCDLVAEADLKPYDYLALVPVIEGAGGIITDWQGCALKLHPGEEATPTRVLAAADARMHARALEFLNRDDR